MIDRLEVVTGDITRLEVDAIVNAANPELRGGGGVDGAIHRAAGVEELQAACRVLGGCPVGEVRITPAFALPARVIVHAVGPVWRGGDRGEDRLLAGCYRHAMFAAREGEWRSMAFPAISCGVYGFPLARAAAIAVSEVTAQLTACPKLEKVVFCCFDESAADIYRQALVRLDAGSGSDVTPVGATDQPFHRR